MTAFWRFGGSAYRLGYIAATRHTRTAYMPGHPRTGSLLCGACRLRLACNRAYKTRTDLSILPLFGGVFRWLRGVDLNHRPLGHEWVQSELQFDWLSFFNKGADRGCWCKLFRRGSTFLSIKSALCVAEARSSH